MTLLSEAEDVRLDQSYAYAARSEPVAFPKRRPDGVVEVDSARLELRAQGIVDAIGGAVFDFVPYPEQELNVVARTLGKRRLRL